MEIGVGCQVSGFRFEVVKDYRSYDSEYSIAKRQPKADHAVAPSVIAKRQTLPDRSVYCKLD